MPLSLIIKIAKRVEVMGWDGRVVRVPIIEEVFQGIGQGVIGFRIVWALDTLEEREKERRR